MKSSFERWNQTPLDRLAKKPDAQRRGIAFQELLGDYLRTNRFEVHSNPLVAKPRQSDLFASYGDSEFLIEAKWVGRKINSSDIDNVRIRLQRTSPRITGCIFSMSDYTPAALSAVESHRDREIILFGPAEIAGLFRNRTKLVELIRRKQKALRIDGKVWFDGQAHKREITSTVRLPKCDVGIEHAGKFAASIPDASGNFEQIVFTRHIPELPWNGFGGNGVGLHLRLETSSILELQTFLQLVHSQLDLSSEGSFVISQQECNWRGFGVQSLLVEMARWRQRYETAKLKYVHHSEDVRYFDLCRSGFLLLSVRQGVGKRPHLHQCEINFILPGIPLDTRPLLTIAEASGHYEPSFEPLMERHHESFHFYPPIPIEPLHRIVSTAERRERLVCGLVVKNPFKRRKNLIPKGKLKDSEVRRLSSPQLLICELSDWHDLDAPKLRYHLTRIASTTINGCTVFNPAGTWVSPRTKHEPPPAASIVEKFTKTLGENKFSFPVLKRKSLPTRLFGGTQPQRSINGQP